MSPLPPRWLSRESRLAHIMWLPRRYVLVLVVLLHARYLNLFETMKNTLLFCCIASSLSIYPTTKTALARVKSGQRLTKLFLHSPEQLPNCSMSADTVLLLENTLLLAKSSQAPVSSESRKKGSVKQQQAGSKSSWQALEWIIVWRPLNGCYWG